MMKKFLSSLLALTMILSLVIVPANAANEITGATGNIVVGDTTTLSVTKPTKVTVSGQEYEVKTATVTSWTSATTTVATVPANSTGDSVVVTAVAEGSSEITCALSVTYYKAKAAEGGQEDTVTTPVSYKTTVNVISAETNLKNTLNNTNIYYKGRTSKISLNSNSLSATIKYVDGETIGKNDLTFSATGVNATDYTDGTGSKTLSVKKGDVSTTIAVTEEKVTLSKPEIKTSNVTSNSIRVGEKGVLTADYTAVFGTANELKYQWYKDDVAIPRATEKTLDLSDTTAFPVSSTPYSITVKVTDKGATTESNAYSLTVTHDSYTVAAASGYKTSMAPGQSQRLEISVTGEGVVSPTYRVAWTSSKTAVADFTTDSKDKNVGVLVAGNKSGSTTVTAKVTFENKDYTVTFDSISVSAADATLEEIVNGSSDYLSDSSLKDTVAKAIKKSTGSNVTGSDIDTIKIATSGFPSHVTLYEDEIKSTSKITSTAKDLTTVDYLYFDTDKGYIGTSELNLNVTLKAGGNGTIAVTLYIPVVGNETIKDTVTGTSANKEVTFTNSDYDYLYYSYSKPTYEGYFNGNKVDGFEYLVKENKTVTVPASKFNNSNKTVTLYVVGVDSKGVASTGTITVSQKSYDIEYSVVAGESVTFSQKDFESFLEDIADDSSDYNSRKDTLELSYVKFSLPNSTREGVLYEGKSKIDRNDKVEDLDKVTFESVAKAKDTITISFTAYGKLYKDGASKGKDVDYSGNVVISVVKEDIVFEVGVNSAIKLGSDKFIDFLRDSDKSYKKADLDYVTFDVGKNSAITSYFNGTGALYRYYNGSTGINATVSAKDEFYYNPKTSSKHYDLDDVTYVTSKFAKVGDIVYIPFTAYGTKSGQKAEGTLAIKVKQTMNFVDVRPGDYFYDSVQWAVNLGITKGTSATTFSPKTGCTRAQIVTFLWRAAKSPEPRSNTSKFTDVYATAHADYMKAINWATEQGITTGTGNGKFSPDATCTRAQIVTFLYRYKNNPAVYGSLNFSDVNKTEHAAFYNAILWAVNNKITTGYGNGIFDPNGTCNRGDAVTFLYRALA